MRCSSGRRAQAGRPRGRHARRHRPGGVRRRRSPDQTTPWPTGSRTLSRPGPPATGRQCNGYSSSTRAPSPGRPSGFQARFCADSGTARTEAPVDRRRRWWSGGSITRVPAAVQRAGAAVMRQSSRLRLWIRVGLGVVAGSAHRQHQVPGSRRWRGSCRSRPDRAGPASKMST